MDTEAFKIVNQTCGAERGNVTLVELYRIIKETFGSEHLLARTNSDRFIAFYTGQDKEELLSKLDKISNEVEQLPQKLNIPKISFFYGIYYLSDKVADLEIIYSNFAH